MEIPEIKQRLSMLATLEHYGLKLERNNLLCCPFHEDKTPSMQVYPESSTVYCFSANCKTHGKSLDVIDFVMYKEGCTKHEAIVKTKSMLNYVAAVPEPKAKLAIELIDNTAILAKVFNYFRNGFIVRKDNNARNYLQGRALDVSKLENLGVSIGYNSAQFHHRGRISNEDMKACEQYGLLMPSNNGSRTDFSYTPWASYCVIFPLVDEKGLITGMYGRSTSENSKNKHY